MKINAPSGRMECLSMLRSLAVAIPAALCTIAIWAAPLSESKASQPGIVFELGSAIEYVHVTPEYSNAVMLAILPYISDVARRLDLPVSQPITVKDVAYCSVLPNRRVEAEVGIKGGWSFGFSRGYVETIQGSHSYHMLQDPDKIPLFYGEVKMSKEEAIRMGRDILKKLGIRLESVFAEQEPRVSEPRVVGSGTVPYYYITWADPRWGSSVEIEINGNAKKVERIVRGGVNMLSARRFENV